MKIKMGYEAGFARDTLNDIAHLLTQHEMHCALDDIYQYRNQLNYEALRVVQMVMIRKKTDHAQHDQHDGHDGTMSEPSETTEPSEIYEAETPSEHDGSLSEPSEPYDFCMALTRVSHTLNRAEFMGDPWEFLE